MSGPVAIVGSGAFGTALAFVLGKAEREVLLYGRDAGRMAEIDRSRSNAAALPEALLPDSVAATADSARLGAAGIVLLAVPAQAQGEVARELASRFASGCDLVICAKGIERSSERFLTAVVGEAASDHRVSVLSGPGFAADMAKGLPTAMTLASARAADAERIVGCLANDTLRLYASSDIPGVEIGGALKNVLAIACGVVDGAALGQSARAALIARGLAEMTRFALAFGGRRETIAGLSGLGDLVLTATSEQSRNFRYGRAIGRGASPESLTRPGEPLSEGAFTASVAARMAKAAGVDMPVTEAVAAIIDGRVTVSEAVEALMRRPLKAEENI